MYLLVGHLNVNLIFSDAALFSGTDNCGLIIDSIALCFVQWSNHNIHLPISYI